MGHALDLGFGVERLDMNPSSEAFTGPVVLIHQIFMDYLALGWRWKVKNESDTISSLSCPSPFLFDTEEYFYVLLLFIHLFIYLF